MKTFFSLRNGDLRPRVALIYHQRTLPSFADALELARKLAARVTRPTLRMNPASR